MPELERAHVDDDHVILTPSALPELHKNFVLIRFVEVELVSIERGADTLQVLRCPPLLRSFRVQLQRTKILLINETITDEFDLNFTWATSPYLPGRSFVCKLPSR